MRERLMLCILCIGLFRTTSTTSTSSPRIPTSLPPKQPTDPELPQRTCLKDDLPCELDRTAFQVISELHAQLDDDKDGGVDPSEADGFFKEELHYGGTSDRSKWFYRNDRHVSVNELWARWKRSTVHNWTTDDVIRWLQYHVELPQYTNAFIKQKMDGPSIPRLAMSNAYFLTNVLQVRNPVHRQKILLKAMDAILFGVPRSNHNFIKDAVLSVLLSVSLAGCWFAYTRYRSSQASLANMTQELDALSRKEESLVAVTLKLEEAERRQEDELREKSRLEERWKKEVEEARAEASRLAGERRSTAEVIDQLKLTEQELELVKKLLAEAERKLKNGGVLQGLPSSADLQMLLQLTYETEVMYHAIKRDDAERQLRQARENCEKVRRKRAAFMGSLRIAHSSTLDDVDRSITEAKSALEEVKTDLQERQFRWSQMEEMTGMSLICNPGLPVLRKNFQIAKARGFSSSSSTESMPPPLIRQDRVEDKDEAEILRVEVPGMLRVEPLNNADLTPTNFPRPLVRSSASGDSSETSSRVFDFDERRATFSLDDNSSQASLDSGVDPEAARRSYSSDQLSQAALRTQNENQREMHRCASDISGNHQSESKRHHRHSNPLKSLLRRRKAKPVA